MNIAVLLTCYNRKEKTLSCLSSLFKAYDNSNGIKISIYLTDDGSTDGTSEAVKEFYPSINILIGDGNLYWAGGMRNSWNEALKYDYDGYLLLNDDTNVTENLFHELQAVHEYCKDKFNCTGVYIGSTHNGRNEMSYGGAVLTSKLLNTYTKLIPNGKHNICDLGNGNIMFVSKEVISNIGIFSNIYIHGLADFDYTLSAHRKKIPVLTTKNYCGICINDNSDVYEKFKAQNLRARYHLLNHPKGLAFADQVIYMYKFYPLRLPLIYFGAFLKLLFPKFYLLISKLR